MKLRQSANIKNKLSATLRNWLPLLQCPINELEAKLKEYASVNPYVDIRSNQEMEFSEEIDDDEYDDFDGEYDDFSHFERFEKKNSVTDTIEAVTFSNKSLYEKLEEQIVDQIFPTPKSKAIATSLITYINGEGFFEGDMQEVATKHDSSVSIVDGIRQRFSMFEPSGIGAIDIKESFEFQLSDFNVNNEVYLLLIEMIEKMENLSKFKKHPHFNEALIIFKKFKNPPALEYMEDSAHIIPDIHILIEDGELKVALNDSFYPDIHIDNVTFASEEPFVKEKIKEAKDLVDAMNMRKATLYKIGLMILEFQYDFFAGGEIKPMKLQDIADDLERNTSTISRAISHKYLACDRGVFSIKSFFSISLGDDTSAKAIKEFVQETIKNEDHKKPLSDQKILDKIQANFSIKMVRRTITKYREQLNIPTSGERKRAYILAT